MAGYKLLKRKGLDDDGLIDNFSDFPLSSPATKIRRLDADLPPIAEVDLELDHDEPLTAPTPEPVEPEVEAPNEERAIVLFKPPSHSPSPFSFTLNPDFISQIKNQVPWSSQRDSDCDRLLKSAADREEQEKKNRGMALVPWVPSTSTSTSYQFPILHETTSTDLMEAEELREGEASMEMDVEQQDISINSPSSTIHPTATTLYPSHDGGLHQWNQQQQQQQHCLLPQIPQSTSTPITWTR